MKSEKTVFNNHYEIISNILTDENPNNKCTEKVKEYEASLTDNSSKSELIRFTRHMALDIYFKCEVTSSNIDGILDELSCISSNEYSSESDAILIMQLSSTLDQFLNELSISEKKIYLYRYFFAYSIEDIAILCNTQAHSIQKTLSQCNNKLSNLLIKNNLVADCKSLLLSFTDIDDNHLLSFINLETCNSANDKSEALADKKAKFSPTLCLNVIFGIVLASLIGLNIYQYIDKPSTATSVEDDTNPDDINIDDINIEDFFIYAGTQKLVNIKKLLEYTTYATDEYPVIDLTIDNYTANYDAYILPESIPLDEFIGDEIPELSKEYIKYYKLLGSDSYQYIIYKYKDDCALFISGYIYATEDASNNSYDTPITYKEVLHNFHSISNASDIEEIRVMAGDSNTGYADCNTYKAIDYEEDIKYIYNTLIHSTYSNGNTIHKLFDNGTVDYDYLMDKSVNLLILNKNTVPVYSLYYYPEGNFFFDFTNYIIYEVNSTQTNTSDHFQELVRFNVHENEPIDPELWLYSLRCTEADPMYLTLNIQCAPQANNIGKYIGSDYTIQKLENNKWADLPILDEYASTPKFLYHQKLDASSSATNLDIYLVEKYGYLQPGTYRLTLTVYDISSGDINNPVSKSYHMDFQIN